MLDSEIVVVKLQAEAAEMMAARKGEPGRVRF